MKTLDDVQQDMSKLYDEFRAGQVERENADSLANITGKYLKAEQLKLARDIFEAEYPARVASVKAIKNKPQRSLPAAS